MAASAFLARLKRYLWPQMTPNIVRRKRISEFLQSGDTDCLRVRNSQRNGKSSLIGGNRYLRYVPPYFKPQSLYYDLGLSMYSYHAL